MNIAWFSNRSISRGAYKEAIDLLTNGTSNLLKHQQGNAAGELANMIIGCYEKMDSKIEQPQLDLIIKIFNDIPDESSDAKESFMKLAIKWTVSKGTNPQGNQLLHLHIARYFAKKKDYMKSSRHYLRCQDEDAVNEHSKLLVEWSEKGYRGEVDLFIARVVLQYLCLQDLQSANFIFKKYTEYYKYKPLLTNEKDDNKKK